MIILYLFSHVVYLHTHTHCIVNVSFSLFPGTISSFFPPWLGLLWMMGLSPISTFRQFSFTVHNLYTILHTLSLYLVALARCMYPLISSQLYHWPMHHFSCTTELCFCRCNFHNSLSLYACATSLLHKPMLNMAVQKGDTSSFFIYVPCQKVLQHSHGSLAPS